MQTSLPLPRSVSAAPQRRPPSALDVRALDGFRVLINGKVWCGRCTAGGRVRVACQVQGLAPPSPAQLQCALCVPQPPRPPGMQHQETALRAAQIVNTQ
jgi:hypothetical protein